MISSPDVTESYHRDSVYPVFTSLTFDISHSLFFLISVKPRFKCIPYVGMAMLSGLCGYLQHIAELLSSIFSNKYAFPSVSGYMTSCCMFYKLSVGASFPLTSSFY